MSMNLNLMASINAETKVGKDKIYRRFDLQQTPTKITREILSSQDILQSYIKWFESLKFDSSSNHINDLLE